MKKIFGIIIVLSLTGCGSTLYNKKVFPPSKSTESWVLYSNGLFHLNAKNYKTALKYLHEAEKTNIELDRVYYHIALCYYNTYDYDSVKKYSELAIKHNPRYTKPYYLLYSMYMNLQNYEKAASILETLRHQEQDNINVSYTLGTLYYSRLKQWDNAEKTFKSILETASIKAVDDYYQEHSAYYLGHIYYSKGQINSAIEHFKLCSEINPDNHSALYALAILHMDRYELDESLEYALLYLHFFPDNVKINSITGRILYLKSDRKASIHLQKAMYNTGFDGLVARALYNELLHKDKDAVILLKKVIKGNTTYISPHLALARINLRKNNKTGSVSEFFTAGILFYRYRLYDNARESFIKALSINDKIPECYFYLAKVYEETERFSQAMVNYKKVLELKPSAEILIHIGYLYSLKSNFHNATLYMDRAIEIDPKNSKSYFFKGLIFTQMDRYPDAEKMVRHAISLNEENDEYHFYLATILEKQNRFDETVVSLKKAIRYNPQSAKSYNFLGYLYADKNMNIDESISLIKKALEFEPDNGAYLDSLGWAYYRKKDFDLALKKLLEAELKLDREKNPDPVVYDHIGDTYKELGNFKKALEYWKKSVKMKKDTKIEKKIKGIRIIE